MTRVIHLRRRLMPLLLKVASAMAVAALLQPAGFPQTASPPATAPVVTPAAAPAASPQVTAGATSAAAPAAAPKKSTSRKGKTKPKQPPKPAAQPVIQSIEPVEQVRGGSVTFTGTGLPTNRCDIMVYLNGANGTSAANATMANGGTSFTFQVPVDQRLGRFAVRVGVSSAAGLRSAPAAAGTGSAASSNAAEREGSGSGSNSSASGCAPAPSGMLTPKMPAEAVLTIFKDSGKEKVVVTGVDPVLGYPAKELYGFVVLGSGFSSRGSDNVLLLDGHGPVAVCWDDDQDCDHGTSGVIHGKVISEQQLSLSQVPVADRGLTSVQVRVGTETSTPPFAITLARVEQGVPLWAALAGLAAVMVLVYVVTGRRGRRSPIAGTIAGKPYGFFTALLLDKETDTYSLSRLQFYLWTAAAIFGYLYLAVSRMLVQWNFDFADVPQGLPGILLISASTSFLAQGIQGAKGPKGAGSVQPTWSDLITTGGVVAPERFQFFVWTILGIGVFLGLVVLHDPAKINDLPKIPSGFMQLMGVSSVGYLGGKMARKAGPVIDEIMARRGSLELTLKGRNLSQDAGFKIGSEDLPSDALIGRKPTVLDRDDQSDDPAMAKRLSLAIQAPKPAWFKGELTIINPDGQRAAWPYSIHELALTEIKPATVPGGASADLTVSGLNFDPRATVQITALADVPAIAAPKVRFVNPEELAVTITPPRPAAGTVAYELVVANPDGTTDKGSFSVG